ncbi:type I polyketide synthase, partial [Streptomyces sp. NPDC005195]|uniref:type I polyketide synthase n=1 Tax=Streptomyces sp. NPDC005195 TaxID=3154561 RepID=UPI00339EEA56
LRDELTALGADVTLVACDTAERAQVERLLAAVPADRPLTGVVHAAGVVDDKPVTALDPERFERVLRPKADGGWLLHELTADHDLTAFVLFSSAAGLLGGAGQANYAAANTVLDALAQHRHGQGLPATSLAWTLWAGDDGMTGGLSEDDIRRIAASGLPAITAEQGLDLLDAALTTGEPLLAPLRLDTAALRTAAGAGRLPVLLRGLVRAPARRTVEAGTGGAPRLNARLAGLEPAEQERLLLDLVRRHAATALGHDTAGAVGADQSFRDLGFDSLTSVELRNRLNTETGLRLPPTLVFDHPRPAALARHLREELGGTTVRTETATVAAADDDPVVIIGMACQYPGGVTSSEELWRFV